MDLLANLQQAGHKFLVAGESMLVAGGVATLTGKGVQLAGSLAEGDEDASKSGSSSSTRKAASKMLGMKGEILAGIGGLLVKVGVVFVVVGFVYAVYLPLLPAMIWTFSIIGWLEKLISLMIALPAWMAGHIIPDGDGLVNGVGRQGYVLLASIILRPPAMILSLHFAMAALGAVGFFLQDFVSLFMPSANEGYLTGIVVGIGGFIVFSGFLVVVAHLILAWIYKIPDDLPLFISGSGGQFGESQGASHLQGAAAVMVAKTEQTIAGAGGGGGPKPPGNPNLARRRTRGQGGHQGTHNRDY
jgi:conjugal transfer/type IV secretion protein DotA/TraY